jgi:sugar lactone lactonase YvrE
MNTVSFTRYALIAGVAAALLSACGGSQSGVYPGPVGQQSVRPRVVAEHGCPTSNCIVVGNGVAGKYPGSILFFRRNANGNVRPAGRIEGSLTQLHYPSGLAMNSAGNIYAANWPNDSITVYAAGSEGNIAPVRTIAGAHTKLRGPTGIALDGEDDLFVVNNAGNRITEYAPNSNGDVRPVRVISGSRTLLSGPWGVALDSSSNIYVTNADGINVYGANAKGNATPERRISGSLTMLGEPEGIAVDASGYAYVANWDAYTLLVFAPGANGNEPPVRVDTSGLYGPDGVAVDRRGRAYVSNGCQDNPAFVVVYAAGASDAEPLRTIEGRKTRLNCSTSLLVR